MLTIDVRDLLGHPGAARTVRVAEPLEDLHTELADVLEGAPVEGSLLLESVVEGVLVSGRLWGSMTLRCARCLAEFDRPFDVEVSELFARGAGPGDDEYALGPDGDLDTEPMVRDAVVLAMPFSPLCRADCLGLCERCGGDRNLRECRCAETPADPRWAGLQRLLD